MVKLELAPAFDLSFWALPCHLQLALFSEGWKLPIRLNNEPAFSKSEQVPSTYFRWTPLEHSWRRYGFTPPVDLLFTARLDQMFLRSSPKRDITWFRTPARHYRQASWTYSRAVRRRTTCPPSDIKWLHHVCCRLAALHEDTRIFIAQKNMINSTV